MSFILRDARQTVNIFASEFTDNIGAIFVSLAIALGGTVIAWILIKIGEWLTGSSSSKRWQYDKQLKDAGKWKETSTKSNHSIIRLVTMGLAILIAISGLWVAAQTAGFNFWTVVLGYGMLSLVGTYAFGDMLRNLGAFFLLSLTDKIEDGYYIEFSGIGVEGLVTAIHWLWIEVSYVNPKTDNVEEIQIPTIYVMSNIIRRKFAMEMNVVKITPNDSVSSSKKKQIRHRLKRDSMV
mgnify:CR=1 FL=1